MFDCPMFAMPRYRTFQSPAGYAPRTRGKETRPSARASILHPHQIKSLRRGDFAATSAVAGGERGGDVFLGSSRLAAKPVCAPNNRHSVFDAMGQYRPCSYACTMMIASSSRQSLTRKFFRLAVIELHN